MTRSILATSIVAALLLVAGTAMAAGPSTTITTPVTGDTISGTVLIDTITTDDTGVASVEFFLGGLSIGLDTNGADGWSLNWNSIGYADGPGQRIVAYATDLDGNTDVDAVYIDIDNSATNLHISDIDAATSLIGSGWQSTVTVEVVNGLGAPIAGATVDIRWANTARQWGNISAVTNASGVATFTVQHPISAFLARFTVYGVSKTGFSYDPSLNSDPDGDSNGSTIYAFRP